VTASLADRVHQRWTGLSSGLQDRLVATALLGMSGPVLGIAAWLEPDPAGVGTHKQLGLGGCTVLTLTGWPCPMCGMTTCFTHMAHFEPLSAAVVQPFGVVLFTVTALVFLVGAASLVNGTAWRRSLALLLRYEVPIAAGTLIGMTAGWLYKCVAMGFWH